MPDNQESKELEQKGELSENWECFCDMAYFDNWAIHNKNDKAFDSVIHVETYDEAKDITDKFNELEQTKEQLTTTQQALDTAVEALEDARNFLIVSTGVHRNMVLEKVEAALADIKGKP